MKDALCEGIEARPLELLRHGPDDLAVRDPKQLAYSANAAVSGKDRQHLGNTCEIINVEAELAPRNRVLQSVANPLEALGHAGKAKEMTMAMPRARRCSPATVGWTW